MSEKGYINPNKIHHSWQDIRESSCDLKHNNHHSNCNSHDAAIITNKSTNDRYVDHVTRIPKSCGSAKESVCPWRDARNIWSTELEDARLGVRANQLMSERLWGSRSKKKILLVHRFHHDTHHSAESCSNSHRRNENSCGHFTSIGYDNKTNANYRSEEQRVGDAPLGRSSLWTDDEQEINTPEAKARQRSRTGRD